MFDGNKDSLKSNTRKITLSYSEVGIGAQSTKEQKRPSEEINLLEIIRIFYYTLCRILISFLPTEDKM